MPSRVSSNVEFEGRECQAPTASTYNIWSATCRTQRREIMRAHPNLASSHYPPVTIKLI